MVLNNYELNYILNQFLAAVIRSKLIIHPPQWRI